MESTIQKPPITKLEIYFDTWFSTHIRPWRENYHGRMYDRMAENCFKAVAYKAYLEAAKYVSERV
jgi:hypothetical protein